MPILKRLAVAAVAILAFAAVVAGARALQQAAPVPLATGYDVFGDIDCDGLISAGDALTIMRGVAQLGVIQNEPCPDVGTSRMPTTCPEIQAAINGLPPVGGAVELAASTYVCEHAIVIDSNGVWLRGQGEGTVLRLANGANESVVVIGSTADQPTFVTRGAKLTDLDLDGNRLNQSTEFECNDGECDTTGHFIRNNCISIRRAEDVLIANISAHGCRSGGLVTEKASRRITVKDSRFYDSQFDGIAGYQTELSRFSGLYIYDNLGSGLSFDLDFNNNVIEDAIIYDNKDNGIFMRDSNDNQFSSIAMVNNLNHGIFLAEAGGGPSTAPLRNTFAAFNITGPGSPATPGASAVRANDVSVLGNALLGMRITFGAGNPEECISEANAGQLFQYAAICAPKP